MKDYYFSRGHGVHKLTEDVENGIDGQFTYDHEVEKYRASHARFLRERVSRRCLAGSRCASITWNLATPGRSTA